MSPERAGTDLRNHALRLALAVTIGLVVETLRATALPPLAAAIAIQLLAASLVAPGGRMVLALLAIMGGSAVLAYLVSIATAGFAGLYAISVGLLYLWGFYLAFGQRTAMVGIMVVTMTVVVTSMAAASTTVAGVLVIELISSIIVGIALVFVAHACFPHRGPAAPAQEGPAAAREPLPPLTRAVFAAAIMLPLHLHLTSDGVAAMVILLTSATMLRQPGLAESTNYSIAFAAGNAAGATLAAVSVLVLSLHNQLPVFVAVTAACSLVIAGQIVRGPRLAAVYVPGFIAYAMLFGLTLMPVPLVEGVEVITRVLQIVSAAVYVLCAASLLAPLALRMAARWPPEGA